MLTKVNETRTDRFYGSPKFMRFYLHIPGPMVNLNVARRVDHDQRVWDMLWHGRYSTWITPIISDQNCGSYYVDKFQRQRAVRGDRFGRS